MSNRAYYEQEREAALRRDGYVCQGCGGKANQTAHGVPQRKPLIQIYGRKIIDSRHNLRASCEACNATLQKRVVGPVALANEVARIEAAIDMDAGK